MKKILFVLVFVTIYNTNYSQGIFSGTGGKLYVGINAGPSFPLSDFSNDNPQLPNSGYATTGYKIEISGGLRLFDVVELSVLGFRNSNGTNPDNLKNSIKSLYPGNDFSIDSDSWTIYGGLGGFSISYPMGFKFIADLRVLGGYMNVSSPEFNFKTSRSDVYYKVESSTESAFVYLSSFGIRYPVLQKLYTTLAFEYIGSSVDFNNVKTVRSLEGSITESTVSFNQSISAWTITAGIKLFLL